MNLKKDIQVIAFLIRNKIAFERRKNFLVINDADAGRMNVEMLKQHECPAYMVLPTPKRRPKGSGKYHYVKKKKVDQVVDFNKVKIFAETIEEKKPFQRPPAVYSNKSYNV